ncbi:MAG: aspartyl/asparaginyl beta-hydroxylase domain-containing protein [Alphaproteobacteria bacterium]|nr:aspartyl/asparaginyl beta-hydroxylase domain-containing protein [Alphaproteobacteria bacterium]
MEDTPFQAVSRAAGLPMAAEIAVDLPLMPVIGEVKAFIETVPDSERGFRCKDGSWSSIMLIGPDAQGQGTWQTDPGRLPLLGALFAHFGGNVHLAALARMAPGDLLDWHYDPCAADLEAARLHLPITTNPQAVSDLGHERIHWPVGGLFYGDFGFPHRVMNDGTEGRVHLYFDLPSTALLGRLPAAFHDTPAARREARQEAVNLHLMARAMPAG